MGDRSDASMETLHSLAAAAVSIDPDLAESAFTLSAYTDGSSSFDEFLAAVNHIDREAFDRCGIALMAAFNHLQARSATPPCMRDNDGLALQCGGSSFHFPATFPCMERRSLDAYEFTDCDRTRLEWQHDSAEWTNPQGVAVEPCAPGASLPTAIGFLRAADGHLAALGGCQLVGVASDAELRWHRACQGSRWLTPIPAPQQPTMVAYCNGLMRSFAPSDGTIQWEVPPGVRADRARVGTEYIVLQSDRDGVAVHDLTTGALTFHDPAVGPASIATSGAQVFVATEMETFAIDASTGTRQWTALVGGNGLGADEDHVLVRTPTHSIVLLDPRNGETLASNSELDARSLGGSEVTAVVGGVAVVQRSQDDRKITVFDSSTLAVLWQSEFAVGSVAVSDGNWLLYRVEGERIIRIVDLALGGEVRSYGSIMSTPPAIIDGAAYHLGFVDGMLAVIEEPLD